MGCDKCINGVVIEINEKVGNVTPTHEVLDAPDTANRNARSYKCPVHEKSIHLEDKVELGDYPHSSCNFCNKVIEKAGTYTEVCERCDWHLCKSCRAVALEEASHRKRI